MAFDSVSFHSALMFSAIILWLSNEAWCWVSIFPVFLAALVKDLSKKPHSRRLETKLLRFTSLSLLVTPHLIFGLICLVEGVKAGLVGELLGFSPGQPYFITAFGAVALLWVVNMLTPLMPLAVEMFLSWFFEPELWSETQAPKDIRTEAVPEARGHAPAGAHPGLPADLLWYGKPVPGGGNPFTRRDKVVGCIILPFALLFVAMGAQLLGQGDKVSVYAGLFCGFLGLLFVGVAVWLMRAESRWNARLAKVEYAFTRDTVYIVDDGTLRTLPLDASLNMTHEALNGNLGTIYLSTSGKLTRALKGIFGKVEVTDMSNMYDASAPLKGFFHIADSMEVFRLLTACRDSGEDRHEA